MSQNFISEFEDDKAVENFTEGFFFEVELTSRYIKHLAIQIFEKFKIDMPVENFVILDILTYCNELCQRDVAKKILKDRASTGKILNALERSGLIERTIDTKNNRLVKMIKLTDLGRKTAYKINQKLEKTRNLVDEKINQKDKINVVNSLRKIRAHLNEIVKTQI